MIYPIFDLDNFTDVHATFVFGRGSYISIKKFGIKGNRLEGATGVWVDINGSPRKICAMGVRASRWVTMHGLAFNISVNLDRFKGIVPCGISDKSVTSLELELNKKVLFNDVVLLFREKFKEVFNIKLIDEKVF